MQALGGDLNSKSLSRGTGRLVQRPKISGEGPGKDLNAFCCVVGVDAENQT